MVLKNLPIMPLELLPMEVVESEALHSVLWLVDHLVPLQLQPVLYLRSPGVIYKGI